jgi:hypothetical protein
VPTGHGMPGAFCFTWARADPRKQPW